MYTTKTDLQTAITLALESSEGTYDIEAITDELHQTYGLIDIDDIPDDVFWDVVLNHSN